MQIWVAKAAGWNKTMIRTLFVTLMFLASPLQADTETEITTALDYFSEVWNAGDLEAIRGYYHPEFVLVTDDGVSNLAQRMDDLESIAQAGEDRGVLERSQIEVKVLDDEHAMAYGKLSLQFKDGSGFNTWFTTVYKKTPFGWKAILTHN